MRLSSLLGEPSDSTRFSCRRNRTCAGGRSIATRRGRQQDGGASWKKTAGRPAAFRANIGVRCVTAYRLMPRIGVWCRFAHISVIEKGERRKESRSATTFTQPSGSGAGSPGVRGTGVWASSRAQPWGGSAGQGARSQCWDGRAGGRGMGPGRRVVTAVRSVVPGLASPGACGSRGDWRSRGRAWIGSCSAGAGCRRPEAASVEASVTSARRRPAELARGSRSVLPSG